MIQFHSDLGGLWFWILIRNCQTKLSDERAIVNKRRNLFFLAFLNLLLVVIVVLLLVYPLFNSAAYSETSVNIPLFLKIKD